MRLILGATLLALGMAAQPALAGEGAASLPGIAAPLLTVAEVAVTPAATFRLSSAALPTISLPSVSPIANPAAADQGEAGLRRRFTGNSMVEYYPVAGSGFHLSGGIRLFARRNFTAETESSAHGLLYGARSTMAPIATRAGFKRFNPALTAGYTFAVSHLAQIGVEGGALMGRAFASAPGLPRYRSDTSLRPDAIANLVFGLHF